MAFRTAATSSTSMLKGAMGSLGCRWYSHVALPAPLERVMDLKPENPFTWHGEFDREMENNTKIEVPKFSFGGSMELMAVPKKKISKHKRGIRNGPRALKPIPVIMRCRWKPASQVITFDPARVILNAICIPGLISSLKWEMLWSS